MTLQFDLQLACADATVPAEPLLRGWVAAALAGRRERAELTLRVVDEVESQGLNREYRGVDRPTNVLSFPVQLPDAVDSDLLGDLVVCAPVVAAEAREQGKSLAAHWAHMLVHGVLHLLGHDHQNGPEADEMEAIEVAVLARLGYPDPYRELSKHE